MPRELGDLTALSALGFFGSLFLMFVLLLEFFTNTEVVPNIMLKIRNADLLIVKWDNIVETIPFIVFLYMYQPLIPQYYKELKQRSMKTMDKMVSNASVIMIIIYSIIGTFGYLTFTDNLSEALLKPSNNGNILECDYKGSFKIQLARLFVIVAVITATPTCIIPAKETYFSLIKAKNITNFHNRIITVILVGITFTLSVALPNVKSAIALTGATINPLIGFIFPILFYLRLETNLSMKSP